MACRHKVKKCPPPIRGDLWPRGNLLTIIKFSQIKITSLLILCNEKKISRYQKMVYWFYLNDNGDGTFQVDHLMRVVPEMKYGSDHTGLMTFRTL